MRFAAGRPCFTVRNSDLSPGTNSLCVECRLWAVCGALASALTGFLGVPGFAGGPSDALPRLAMVWVPGRDNSWKTQSGDLPVPRG